MSAAWEKQRKTKRNTGLIQSRFSEAPHMNSGNALFIYAKMKILAIPLIKQLNITAVSQIINKEAHTPKLSMRYIPLPNE